ncbi:aminoacetone oxidase family FAD-binding enzyme [Candidatus Peregrinibacteria bacterium HGW-Peregrinibacteria-1]|jgi:hypothetical protein|nr:MAG: aminoacetone oxidase family FAD-binding enzyme [Candidatus Peregrinibacteria bacterium HGW-Peregrinibacteria-1]
MMAAATICEQKADLENRILLFERNLKIGHKVMISGGGRCNVTTGIHDPKEALKRYPRGAKFLRTAFHAFPPDQVMEWFENHHVALKTEKDLRVFPKSDNGEDIVNVFHEIFRKHHVEIHYRTTIAEVHKQDDQFVLTTSEGQTILADKIILTTGGQAYRHTGSQGDGYRFAESLGHTVTELAPSLNSFMVSEQWLKELSGTSFQKVRLKIIRDKKYEFTGPILFTHQGITGPAVFALSGLAAYEPVSKDQPATLSIDFHPDQTYEQLTNELNHTIKTEPQKQLIVTIGKLLTKSLARTIFELHDINPEKKQGETAKKELNKLIESLKNTQITLIGKGAGSEFITAGGINLAEVNPSTMESRLCPGLYFGGEILNIDGFTGGFNLQAAWATGRLIGKSIGNTKY